MGRREIGPEAAANHEREATAFERTLSTVSIANKLLFVADLPGRVHCLDAETGRCHWVHDCGADAWSSTFAAGGKVFLGTRKSLCVLAAEPQKKVLGNIVLGSQIRSTPAAANGVLYVASQRYLWAVAPEATAARTPPP